jgi:uncharacterized protein YjbJ (UPF0337 family)
MNVEKIRSNWNVKKDELKENFAELTEADLYYNKGEEEELVERIQEKTGKSKDEVIRLLEEL